MSNSITSNRSTLKEFLASIATIQGDLSNITAPPFVLGEFSTVELPQYWADHPSLFVAPALEKDPEKRALLVLKWFLGSLRNQQYASRREEDGVKKPLNAFLGELFLGSWKDESGETRLVSEQVSHHPPVTACHLWNDQRGIRAEGFTQQEITFSGSVSIKQKGYAILHIDEYEEDYLIPVPNVKVKGIVSGTPYPELVSSYSIISSSGIVSEIKFEGKTLLGFGSGSKNGFEARTFRTAAPAVEMYTAKGSWNGQYSIQDARSGEEIERFDVGAQRSVPITVVDRSEQDPWESRRAWGGVVDALRKGDMKGTADAKSIVEEGQRQMRRDEDARGEQWQRLFFRRQDNDPIFEKLYAADKDSFTVDPEGGIWKIDSDAIVNVKKPYRGDLLPTGQVGQDIPKAEQQLHSEQFAVASTSPESTGGIQPLKLENETGDSQEQVTPDRKIGISPEEIQDTQVEAMLRAKYQSAPH
ncbi:Oxysterol-binding protein [Karstenula rhodostoma CBS 690.94]|uniref:Oxysterol-binding protein n=1 Tax=Karstenula rhodostoma CBS 690.94 TaxID=1392251 RepID=A0A9P4PW02_9PLEO|nr:Oxysterol-binding protein [Karstenula rhodostoma CBS 690.94]